MLFLLALNAAAVVSQDTEIPVHRRAGRNAVSGNNSDTNEKYQDRYYGLKDVNLERKLDIALSIITEQFHVIEDLNKVKHIGHSHNGRSSIGDGLHNRVHNRHDNDKERASRHNKGFDLIFDESELKKMEPRLSSHVVKETVEKTCSDGYDTYKDYCRKVFSTPAELTCLLGSVRLGSKCVTRTPVTFTCPEGYVRGNLARKTDKIGKFHIGDLCYKSTAETATLFCPEGFEMDTLSWLQPTCKKEFKYEVAVCSHGTKNVNGKCIKEVFVGRKCPDGYVLDGDWCIKTYEEACPKSKNIHWLKNISKKEKTEKGETSVGTKSLAKARRESKARKSAERADKSSGKVEGVSGKGKAKSAERADKSSGKVEGVSGKGKAKSAERADKSHQDTTSREDAKQILFNMCLSDVKESGGLGDFVDKIFAERKTRSMTQLESVIDQKNQFWDGVVHAEKAVREKGVSGSVSGVSEEDKIYVRRGEAGFIDSAIALKKLENIHDLKGIIMENQIAYAVTDVSSDVCEWEQMVPAYKVVEDTALPHEIEETVVLQTVTPKGECEEGYELVEHKNRGKLCVIKESKEVIGTCNGEIKGKFCIQEEDVRQECQADCELINGDCVRYAYKKAIWSWTVLYTCEGCDEHKDENINQGSEQTIAGRKKADIGSGGRANKINKETSNKDSAGTESKINKETNDKSRKDRRNRKNRNDGRVKKEVANDEL